MTDTELTLAVARAIGLDAAIALGEVRETFWPISDLPEGEGRYELGRVFDPLNDDKWAVPMMVWLAGRGMLVKVSPIGCLISQALEPAEFVESFADHPTRNDAIRRCLCVAVAAVGEQ